MDSHDIGFIVSLGILLAFSAFFSAGEMAFSSLNRLKLKNMAARGNKRAALALKITENYDKLLSTVLIGNNVVNIASSALATVLFVGFFGTIGVSLSTLTMTLLVLLFGEISPKTLAKEAPERVAMFTAPLLRFFIIILSPVNHLFSLWKQGILRLFGIKPDRSVTEAELLTFVEEVRQEGGINEQEEKMIRRTIAFDDLTANDIYTPRVDVAAVSLSDTSREIERKFIDTGYSRLPVYKESIDNILGVILFKDFYSEVSRRQGSLESVIKSAVFVTKSMKISRLLKTLQEKKSHLAVLVDEFGGTMGIITIEDILEELVGEIWDEHDEVVEQISALGGGAYRVLGNTALKEFFAFFSIDEGDEKTNATTLGSWVVEKVGGVPQEGEGFTFRDLSVKISKTRRHRVLELTVSSISAGLPLSP